MILVGTVLNVIDNSGAKKVKCIKILGGFNKKIGIVGNFIIVSVQTINPLKKIKKGEIYKAVIVCTKTSKIRKNGSSVFFNKNGVVIINNKNLPLATRLLSPVMGELREVNLSKIISMATIVI
jgi:large subunit ribosomal protein L14